ncbi:MAG: DNA internalization-related competence protein ComEC/Rec2 [Mogibacterium sp.]|nr:DNA internalization-related competence protein ComEC/Rec2 [Mogibacterium sp.]
MEETKLIGGSLLLIITGTAAAAMSMSERNSWKEVVNLAAFLLAGFMLFTLRFISYEADCSLICDTPDQMSYVEGTAESITCTDEKYRIVLGNAIVYDSPGDDHHEQRKIRYKVQINYYGRIDDTADLMYSRIGFRGKLRKPLTADNPGCFDPRLYSRSKGISCVMTADMIRYDDQAEPEYDMICRWKRYIYRIREEYIGYFRSDQIQGFIRGVIFGDKSSIDEETREDFDINSTGHILAVSGLHIGFIYALLKMLTGRRKTLPLTIIVILLLVAYGEMTMWSASTIRAVIVLSLNLMALYARRHPDLLTSVSTAAILILSVSPYQLFDQGFRMSFAALTGIAVLTGFLKSFLGEALAVMIAVQCAVAPLTAYIFHRINFLSIFINIPVIAIASVLVPLCIISLAADIITGSVPGPVLSMTEDVASLLIRLNSTLADEGGFSGMVVSVNPGVLLLFYLTILLICSEWFRVRALRRDWHGILKAVICLLLISVVTGMVCYNTFADDEIVFVSVGQGDCVHIRADGNDVLIDGGGSAFSNVGESILMPYLLSNGVDQVDLALVTHLHMDHYQGIRELSEIFPVAEFGIPADYRRSAGQNGQFTDEVIFIDPGSTISVSEDVRIDVIWPPPGRTGDIEIDDPNEHNMVYMINCKDIRIMVTGDLLEADELDMLEYYRYTDTLKCDVLKVAHHGSKSSTTEEFLEAADPAIAVIQVGRNNLYGHPHDQTLKRLEERGVRVCRTDNNGAVGIDIRRGSIAVDTMRN